MVNKCEECVICPVIGLQLYVSGCKKLRVNLSKGYLFRILTEDSKVLEQPVSYSFVYESLRTYLRVLNIDNRETSHSFWADCTVA